MLLLFARPNHSLFRYVRKKTFYDFFADKRVMYVLRNESIARQKHAELSGLISTVTYIPYFFDLEQLLDGRCFIITIENFRSLYLKSPGHFDNSVFIFDDFQYIGNSGEFCNSKNESLQSVNSCSVSIFSDLLVLKLSHSYVLNVDGFRSWKLL